MSDNTYQFFTAAEFEAHMIKALHDTPHNATDHWNQFRILGLVIKMKAASGYDIRINADSAYLGFGKPRAFQLLVEAGPNNLESALKQAGAAGFFTQVFGYFYDGKARLLLNYDAIHPSTPVPSDAYVLTHDLLESRAADQKHISRYCIGKDVTQQEIHNMTPLRWIQTLDGVHDLNGKRLSAQIAAAEDNFFGSVGTITVAKGDNNTVAVSVAFNDEHRLYQFYLTEPQACRIALPAAGDVVDEPYDFVYRGLLVPEVEVAPVE